MIIKGVTIRGNPDANEWVTQYKLGYKLQTEALKYYVEPYNIIKVRLF